MATPYATPARLREALERGGASLPESDNALPTSWPDTNLVRHLEDASQTVDSRLGAVVSVPYTDPVPELVVSLTVDIAAYRAMLAFRGNRNLQELDPFLLRYRDAIKHLEAIAAGKATVPPAPGAEPSAPADTEVINPYQGHMFGMSDFGLGQAPPGAEHPYSSGRW